MLNKKHINKLTIALLALGVSQMACKTSYMPKKQNQAYLATNIGGGLDITVPDRDVFFELCDFLCELCGIGRVLLDVSLQGIDSLICLCDGPGLFNRCVVAELESVAILQTGSRGG